ncbi:MAG: ComF family protein [Armatimonadota bacterium]|nr:ComF family protein [Armatimonadota bacterium]MCX7777002.1 ComF family protein [Armatimonadota bacterium]MDW8024930.1 ComF family protein [Armatimonadota bacterium]
MSSGNRWSSFFPRLKEVTLKGVHIALRMLYPPRCLVCDSLSDEAICVRCFSRLKFIKPPMCALCGKPYDELAQAAPICSDCRRIKRWFDRCRCTVRYEDVAREMIHKLKYSGERRLASEMAKLMVETLNDFSHPVDLVIPVPLHRKRLRERGFNQAWLIADVLSECINARMNSTALIRARETKPQFDLEPKERLGNVRDAFELVEPSAVTDKVVLVVDDVMTVGATLNECARALKKGKPKAVYAVAFARAVGM